MRGIPRRALLAAVVLGTAGCSALPQLDGGTGGLAGMADRIDPAPFVESGDRAQVFHTRPQSAAEVLGIEADTDIHSEEKPVARFRALLGMMPSMFALPVPFWSMNPAGLVTPELLTRLPEVGVLRSGMQEVGLWTDGAALLDDLEAGLDGFYAREGDELRFVPAEGEDPRLGPRTQLIAPVEKDLLFTSAESTAGIDGDGSLAELFTDLPGLLAAVDLEDAHLATTVRGSTPEDGSDHASEWLWATRFEDAEECTTRGAARVVGDITAYAERLLDAAARHEDRLHVVEAEVDEDLLLMTLSTSSESDDLVHFYTAMPENLGPGVPL